MMNKPRVLVITGPTASGKTALALHLASILPMEVINADSMQVYRGMDIGTAKPSRKEVSLVRHHLIDIREPDEDFSVGEYAELFRRAVGDIASRGAYPVAVGGSGLYIRGALGGLFEGPARNEAIRSRLLEEERREEGILYRRLLERDPETAARTSPRDLVRLVRALEVLELTGRPISEHQRVHAFSDRPYDAGIICLDPPRPLLSRWIEQRVDRMMAEGLLEELRGLREKGYGPELNSMKALGYRELNACLTGDLSLEQASALIKRNTRRYAKRQRTWFRGERGVKWTALTDHSELEELAGRVADWWRQEAVDF